MNKKTLRTFLIISSTPHYRSEGRIYAYGPYVREMNLWLKNAGDLLVVAPLSEMIKPDPILEPYERGAVKFFVVPRFNTTTFRDILRTIFLLPGIILKIYRAMDLADHIHIRCPGNMGMLALLVQVFFPGKTKTVKYAGNWKRYKGESATYRIQKFLAASPGWCKKTKVLVYADRKPGSGNIKPFFTATYREEDKLLPVSPRDVSRDRPVRLLFVGTLTRNKRPLIPVEACKDLKELGIDARLDIFGAGPMKDALSGRIRESGLGSRVSLHGNVAMSELRKYYTESHFLILPSFSEGWPKAVAEAMFWGCVPIVSDVSCVPFMLGNGERGRIVEPRADAVVEEIKRYVSDPSDYRAAANRAMEWSRRYTLDRFEEEIEEVMEKAWS